MNKLIFLTTLLLSSYIPLEQKSFEVPEINYNLIDSSVLYLPFTGNIGNNSENRYTILASDKFYIENSVYYFDGIHDKRTVKNNQLTNQ